MAVRAPAVSCPLRAFGYGRTWSAPHSRSVTNPFLRWLRYAYVFLIEEEPSPDIWKLILPCILRVYAEKHCSYVAKSGMSLFVGWTIYRLWPSKTLFEVGACTALGWRDFR